MRTSIGLLLVTAMIAVSACATGGGAPAAPPSVDVTGEWVGTWAYQNVGNGSGDIRGRFHQEGANVTGSFNVTGPVVNNVANIIGTVSGNTIKLMMPASGYLTVNGNQITGYVNGMNVANLTMRKQ